MSNLVVTLQKEEKEVKFKMKIESVVSKLTVPCQGKEINFRFPSFEGTFEKVGDRIRQENLSFPSSSEVASLIFDAWKNPEGNYEKEILKSGAFWESTGNLYLPRDWYQGLRNGVILFDANSYGVLDRSSFYSDTERLINYVKEGFAKFISYGFKMGDQKPSELEKNAYILARYGEEGAQKIAEIASKYSSTGYLSTQGPDLDEPSFGVSSLYQNWDGGRLGISGISDYNFGRQTAFATFYKRQ